MITLTLVLLYLVVSAFVTNMILDNVFRRCENPHYQVQAYNPLMFMICLTFGWLVFVPLCLSILLMAAMNKFSLNEAFNILAKKLDDGE